MEKLKTKLNKDNISEASKRAKRNKTKGNRYELEIVHKLHDIGYTGCKTSRFASKMHDDNKIDIVDINNELPINIQVKATLNTPNYFEIKNACPDKEKPFCVFWKKQGKCGKQSPGQVAIVPLEYFYELIKK